MVQKTELPLLENKSEVFTFFLVAAIFIYPVLILPFLDIGFLWKTLIFVLSFIMIYVVSISLKAQVFFSDHVDIYYPTRIKLFFDKNHFSISYNEINKVEYCTSSTAFNPSIIKIFYTDKGTKKQVYFAFGPTKVSTLFDYLNKKGIKTVRKKI